VKQASITFPNPPENYCALGLGQADGAVGDRGSAAVQAAAYDNACNGLTCKATATNAGRGNVAECPIGTCQARNPYCSVGANAHGWWVIWEKIKKSMQI